MSLSFPRPLYQMSKFGLSLVNSERSHGWAPSHHINQIHPQGADKNYVNGAYNCGPAAVAMLARGHGKMNDLSDAQLVQQLGQGIVTKDGVDANGIGQMLERAGVPPAGEALGAGYADADVKAHLDQGHKFIAQVRSFDPETKQASSHYVVIQGKTPRGNYIVSDPLADKPYIVSPDQLKEAVLKCPPDGGMLIPISSPAEAKAAEAQKTQTPNGVAAPVPGQGGDTFETVRPPAPFVDPVAPPALGGAPVTVAPPANGGVAPPPTLLRPIAPPSLIGGAPFVGPIAPPAAGGGAPVAGPVAPQTPVAAPEEVNKDAFTATDDVLDGTDTTFHKNNGAKVDDRMKDNQRHHNYHVGMDYGHHHGGHHVKRDGKEASVTPSRQSAQDFANQIIDLKRKGDPKAYDILAMLETSDFDKDQRVLELVKNADLQDGGIGKRIEGDGF